jgi:streptogramin lyase
MALVADPLFCFLAFNYQGYGWSESYWLRETNEALAHPIVAEIAEARAWLLAAGCVLEFAALRNTLGVPWEWAAIGPALQPLPIWTAPYVPQLGLMWRFEPVKGRWAYRYLRGVPGDQVVDNRWIHGRPPLPATLPPQPTNPAGETPLSLWLYFMAMVRERTAHRSTRPVNVGGVDLWDLQPWSYVGFRKAGTRDIHDNYRRASWEPRDWPAVPDYSPCGCVTTVLRECYSADCRFYASGPTHGIRYYWSAPGAVVLPFKHITWGLARDGKVHNSIAPGETTGPGARAYSLGLSWGAAPGVAPTGTEAKFLGQTVSPFGLQIPTPPQYRVSCDMPSPTPIEVYRFDLTLVDANVTKITVGNNLTVAEVAPGWVEINAPDPPAYGLLGEPGKITFFDAPVRPGYMKCDDQGNVWFQILNEGPNPLAPNGVGRMTPDGVFTVFADTERVFGIWPGPDGLIYYAEDINNALVQLDPATGVTTRLNLPPNNPLIWESGPHFLCTGPDGNLWLTHADRQSVFVIDTDLNILAEYAAGGVDHPKAICLGPDGNLWITCDTDIDPDMSVLQMSPLGLVLNRWHIPALYYSAWDISPGPDGNVYFVPFNYDAGMSAAILRVNLATMQLETVFELPGGGAAGLVPGVFFADPFALCQGPDGRLWFSLPGIFTLTGGGLLEQLSGCTPPDSPAYGNGSFDTIGIAAGSDRRVYFSCAERRQIGAIDVEGMKLIDHQPLAEVSPAILAGTGNVYSQWHW